MALSSPGIGSGLDVNSLVAQLMAIERRPLTRLDQQEATFQAQISAYGSVKGALSSLQSAAAALVNPATMRALKTTVADSTLLTATVGASAVIGSYAMEATTLAQAHKLKSASFSSPTTVVGSGAITIAFGAYADSVNGTGIFTLNPDKAAKTVTLGSSQSTLAGIRDAINAAGVGVAATILNDGTGHRLVLSSQDTGLVNQLKITASDDDATHSDNTGLSQLVYDGTVGLANLTKAQAAQNAALTIDGIAVSQASNTLTDAIQGVTLTVLKTNLGSPTRLTVVRDNAVAQSAVEGFVKAANDTLATVKTLSAYNATTKQAAILQADATVRAIQTALRRALTQPLTAASGGLTTLSDIGLSFQKDGTLTLERAKLQTVIADPTKDLATFFAAVQIDTVAGNLLRASGTVTTRTEGIARSITDLTQHRDVLTQRLTRVEARLRAQFSALDTALGQLRATSDFLTQQLSRLPTTSSR